MTRSLRRVPVRLGTSVSRQVKALYLAAFPANERFPYWPTVLNSLRSFVHLTAYYDGEDFVGFTYTIEGPKMVFLCFLAVVPDCHSRGYGSQMIEMTKALSGDRPLTLSIEPMDEKSAANYQQRLRRLSFYERNGFQLSQNYYFEGKERYQLMATDLAVDWQDLQALAQRAVLNLIPIKVE